jgi:Protein of unknown function (DUF3551)
MRGLAMAVLAIGAACATGPARAQTFDPDVPVCMHVYGDPTYWECRFSTLAQCAASASGRAAQCVNNPYLASEPAGPRYRHRRAY